MTALATAPTPDISAAAPPPPALALRGVDAFYGPTQVLFGIDLEVAPNSVLTLLGANGAGKTTTLRAISRMVRTRGEIALHGAPMDRRSTEAVAMAGVGHVPDGRGTFNELSAEENLRLGAYARRDKDGIAADIEEICARFPRLHERRRQQAGTLSGGEQQMLSIGRALMSRPSLLLLDEPSFGVAPLVIEEIFAVLAEIQAERHMAILLVEQDAALALEFADHACLLETGRIVARGPADALAADETVRRSYLGY